MKKGFLLSLLFLFSIHTSIFSQTNVRLVKDISPGFDGGGFYDPISLNGNMLFFARVPSSGMELWSCDVNMQVNIVKDIYPGSSSGIMENDDLRLKGVIMNGIYFFQASDAGSGLELWASNGSTLGTGMVKDINPGAGDGVPIQSDTRMVTMNNKFYFEGNDGTLNGLWKSDGTGSGTQMVKDSLFLIKYPIVVNSILYFSAYSSKTLKTDLWRSDGTTQGTYEVHLNANACCGLQPLYLENLNGLLVFSGVGDNDGRELWRSDGTVSGTTMISDIRTGIQGSFPERLTAITGFSTSLFFIADNGTNGRELWISDGTGPNTVMIKDINQGPGNSNIDTIVHTEKFAHINGKIFFSADNGIHGNELWMTDGTPNGTLMKEDINPGSASSFPQSFYNHNGSMYFSADDGVWGRELYETNDIALGALLLEDIRQDAGGSYPTFFADHSGLLLFAADDTYNGFEIRALVPSFNSSWTSLNTGTVNALNSIFMPPSTSNVIFAAGNNGVILKSNDNGNTWTNQNSSVNNALRAIYFTDANTGYVAGASGIILKTTNGGINWTQQSSGTTFLLRSIYFTDANTGYIVGSGGTILKTTNGGGTWNALSSGTTLSLTSILFQNPNTGFIVGLGGTLLKTINSGLNWTVQTSGTSTNLNSITFNGPDKGMCVGNNGVILKTIDSGQTWNTLNAPTAYPLFSIIPTGPDTFITSGGSGIIFKTTNGGTSWIEEENLTSQTLNSLRLINNEIFACGGSGKIIKTYQGSPSYIIDTEEFKAGFIVYPNPMQDETTVLILHDQGLENADMTIYNFLGEEVQKIKKLNGNKVTFERGDLASGMYFFNITQRSKSVAAGKFIVK